MLVELGQPERLGKPVALEPKTEGGMQPATVSANGFYGVKPETKQEHHSQGLPSRTSRPMDASMHVHPIESLSPYGNKWTVKARVTSKSDIKTWHNKNGEGKLFSVNLLDESGEIKATGFNDQCDMFFDRFQEGNVYYISSPCRVQLAKKQFSNLNNDYELTFENNTRVEKAENQADVPQIRFNFTSIGSLQSIEKDAVIDTIGVLREVGAVSEAHGKTTGKSYNKRELTLVDNTNYSVRITLWGSAATSFGTPPESIIAFKGVKVSDFNGRSLSLLSSGTINVNPDVNEAHVLRGWYDAQGRTDEFTSHATAAGAMGGMTGANTSLKTIQAAKDENLGLDEKPDYFSVKATIIYIKHKNPAYPSCPEPECKKKKVFEDGEGGWRCEKCEKNYPKPEYRYVLSVNIADHSGQMYLSCFDEIGKVLLGMDANQLMEIMENGTDKEVWQEVTGQSFIFRCRAKMDNYNGEQAYVSSQCTDRFASGIYADCSLAFGIKYRTYRPLTTRRNQQD